MIRTFHQFIQQTCWKSDDKYAIIGTIHPHRVDDFDLNFFYGNKGFLWSILGQAFPNLDFTTVESIKRILSRNRIWITDMIEECSRPHERETRDSHLYDLKLNTKLIEEGLRGSQIDTIFLTSRFERNNAAELFIRAFGLDLLSWNEELSQFIIPSSKFGREIRAVVLFSPSGRANLGISRSKSYLASKDRYGQEKNPVALFKIDFYRDKFAFLV